MKKENIFHKIFTRSFFFFVTLLFFYQDSFSQGAWTSRTNFGGAVGAGRKMAVAFSIGNKGYIGTGFNSALNPWRTRDFWEYDPASGVNGTWTQKADLNGAAPARHGAIGFSIGSKGYIVTGYSGTYPQDLREYDPVLNTWTARAVFPGSGREMAVGFSVGTKGYVGTGGAGFWQQDFWEWDQPTNTWQQKANFPGPIRFAAVGFSIAGKGYIGTGAGATAGVLYQDLWEYTPGPGLMGGTWAAKANFPQRMAEGTAFTIGNYGFVGIGTTSIGSGSNAKFWRYDPVTDAWTSIADFAGGIREMAPGFSIGCRGYVATGFINDNNSTFKHDLWEFSDGISATITANNALCTGHMATLTAAGGTQYQWSNGATTSSILVSSSATNSYTVSVTNAGGCTSTHSVVVTQPASILLNITSVSNTHCITPNGTATVNAGGGTPGYSYLWSDSAGQTTQTATGLSTGSYTVIVTDANGCTQTQTVSIIGPVPPSTNVASINVSCAGVSDGSATVTVAGGTAPYTYVWSTTPVQNSATATGLATGSYSVIISDAGGCTKDTSVTIAKTACPCPDVTVPNAFSPNGDLENDEFCLPAGQAGLQGALEDCIIDLAITIYDRWGEPVYVSKEKKFCWNGKYKDKLQNTAVYVYYLEATLISGIIITKKGNISLIR